eukprot:comp21696_c0_seq1/m.30602 comp21696_c0_seq1/g.30602  ORF comp21696_c0_seq1/g.30602 comp21696_c0_seq1/m.30602 type:complete len:233 (-) comp21696_c0_seq1:286-984(-)
MDQDNLREDALNGQDQHAEQGEEFGLDVSMGVPFGFGTEGENPAETEGQKQNGGDEAHQENINEEETRKRQREDDDAELPPEKIPAVEVTTSEAMPPQDSEPTAPAPASEEQGVSRNHLSVDSKKPTDSMPSVGSAETSKPSSPATPARPDREAPKGEVETAGNESHADVMGLPARKMLPKLRGRSMELDNLREQVREWLCVLQPDMAGQLRERPWAEVYRLFVRMLEANKP